MRKQEHDLKKVHRYSIRKFKFGAASITVGTLLFLGLGISTKAAEVDSSAPTEQTSLQEATEEKLAEELEKEEKPVEEVANEDDTVATRSAEQPAEEETKVATRAAEVDASVPTEQTSVPTEQTSSQEATEEKLAEELEKEEKPVEEVANEDDTVATRSTEQPAEEETKVATRAAEVDASVPTEQTSSQEATEEKLAEELEKEEKPVEEVANEDDTVATRSTEQPAEEETKVATRAAANDGQVNSGDVDKELQNKIEQKAVYSPGQWGQKEGYQGTVTLQKDGTQYGVKKGDSPVANAKVYLQWTNKDGVLSPVYYTTSGADGRFVIDLSKPFQDGAGNSHKFQIAGDDSVAIRTWVTLEDEERYEVVKGGDGKQNFHKRLQRTNESWDFTAGINRIVNSEVLVQEKKNLNDWLHKPEDEWTTSGTSDGIWIDEGDYGKIKGNVWYELYELSGSDARWLKKDTKDVYATGVKVAASYVNDDVTRLFDTWKKENPNATLDDFRDAQAKIVADYQAEHGVGSHIAETVVGTVDKDGNYYIPFKGLYGANAYEKGNNQVTEEEYSQLVKDADISHNALVLWNGNTSLALNKKRHINSDYMYVTPLIDNTVVYANNYRYNMFTSADVSRDIQDAKMLASSNGSSQDFALLVTNPMHDISIEDSNEEVAKPGDILVSETGGLFPNREYQIQWFKDGVPVGDPVTVTSDNEGRVGSVPLNVPEDLDKETIYTSGVFLQNEDTSSTTEALALDSIVAFPFTEADKYTPEYEGQLVVPGTPAESTPTITDKDGNEVDAPEGTKFTIDENFTVPEGYTVEIDETTGVVTVNAPEELDADTEEEFDVPVVVTYPDESTDETTANFKLDTDGDGTQDTEDEDDDGDGVPDEEEKDNGTNPKSPEDSNLYEPEVEDVNKEFGEPTTEDDVTGAVTVPDFPTEGEQPVITVDDPTQLPDGETPGSYEVDVTVTYPDGTTDEVTVKVTVGNPQSENYEPEYEGQLVVPGTPAESTPTITDKDGNEVDAPEGTKFTIDENFTVPEGYTVEIDETTGVVTVNAPEELDADTEEEFDVPVVVTYPDESTDETTANFKLDTDGDGTQDTEDEDDDGDGVPDEEEKDNGTNPKSPEDSNLYEPEVGDVNKEFGQPTTEDDVTGAVTVPDFPTEGEQPVITVDDPTQLPDGETPGSYEVDVTVTYPDGTTDEVTVKVTVGNPQSENYEPEYEGQLVVPGTPAESTPTITDKDGNEVDAPEGTKFTIDENFTVPEGYTVEIDETTGVVTVNAPEELDADTEEEFDVPVVVTYPDESTDETTANFKLDTDGDGTQDTEDEDDDGDGVPDEEEKDNGTNPKSPEDSNLYEPEVEDVNKEFGQPTTEDDVTGAVTVPDFPTEGEQPVITVDDPTQLPDGETPGSYEVDVTVTYPDGTTDEVTVKVTVGNPQSENYEPEYEGQLVVPGTPAESTPTITDKDGNEVDAPEGTKFTIDENFTVPEGYTVEIDETTGVVTVNAPEELDADTEEEFDVPVVVTYPDESTDETTANFKLDTDGDGTQDTEDEDDDGDGVPDEEEKDNGTNPKSPEDSNLYEPEVEDVNKEFGQPTTEDDVTGAVTVPDFPTEGEQPVITVDDPTQLPDGETPGSYEVDVTVTYPDGTKDHVKVPVVVGEEDNVTPPADNETYEPVVDKVEKDHGTPTTEEDVTGAVTVPDFPTEGEQPVITVDDPTQLPDGETPGSYEVDVTVTYPDGTEDHVKVPVVVGEEDNVTPPADNETYEPVVDKVEKDHGTPTTEEDVTGAVTVPDFPTEGEQPVITVDDPTQLPDGETPGSYEVDVTVTYPDGTEDHVKVIVTVTDKDDNVDVVTPNPPTVNPVTEGDKEIHGGGTPGNTIEVTFPDGTIVETGVDDNGEWTVNVPGGIVLKPGDVITAVEKDKDGNVSKATEVIVGALKSSTPVTGNTDNGSDSGSKSNTNSYSESKVLPNTGEAKNNSGFIAGTAALFAGMGALILGRRRKEEE